MNTISIPTEQTADIGAHFSKQREPLLKDLDYPESSKTGMNVPEKPPTLSATAS